MIQLLGCHPAATGTDDEGKRKGEKRELYDLAADPSETKDVIGANADVAADLTAKLTKIVNDGRSSPGKPVPNDTPPWDDLLWIKP